MYHPHITVLFAFEFRCRKVWTIHTKYPKHYPRNLQICVPCLLISNPLPLTFQINTFQIYLSTSSIQWTIFTPINSNLYLLHSKPNSLYYIFYIPYLLFLPLSIPPYQPPNIPHLHINNTSYPLLTTKVSLQYLYPHVYHPKYDIHPLIYHYIYHPILTLHPPHQCFYIFYQMYKPLTFHIFY